MDSTTRSRARPESISTSTPRTAWMLWSSIVVAAGIVVASVYGLLATDAYRGISAATALGARAQDVCSLVVAGLLVLLVRRDHVSPAEHLVRLGLLGYVVYSYAIYLTGLQMNRVFLVYVVITSVAGAALLDGLFRLDGRAWPRVGARRLERGTGWMLVVVAVLFAGLWLSTLVPYAAGGPTPDPEGPGGVPYPVFVLDLVVVLPCVGAVGWLLLQGRQIAGPLAVVALIKIVTLFTALWAGTVAVLLTDTDFELAADAGPSLVLLIVSVWLVVRWLRALSPGRAGFLRPSFWEY